MAHNNPDSASTPPSETPRLGDPLNSPAPDTASILAGEAEPGGGDTPVDEPLQPRTHAKKPKSGKGKSQKQDPSPPSEPERPATRILTPLELPAITLDRRLLPTPLIGALTAAGLGDKAHLPAAAFMSLAAIGAIVGSNLQVETPGGQRAPANLALRVVALTPEHGPPLMAPAILAGVHAVEADRINTYAAAVEQNANLRRAAEQRRRLYEQAAKNAAALGFDPPLSAPDIPPPTIGPRPQIVVENGARRAIQAASAGGTGLLVIHDAHMASMDHVAGYYDRATDALLNAAAAGHLIAIKDPKRGSVAMQPVAASVVGVLALSDCADLHVAGTSQLGSTLFVAASPPPVAPDVAPFVALMRAVAAIPPGRLRLRVSKEASVAMRAWAELAEAAQRPLSDFVDGLEDLALRLAATLHIISMAGGTSKTVQDISPATLGRAIAIIDSYVVPVARSLLAPISHGAAERDARRIVAHARDQASPAYPVLDRRSLLRAWQRSMDGAELDAALALLVREGLLAALDSADGGGGGQRFRVEPIVFETA